jgi:putative PEP-CTERM system integral membrane protein
MQSHAQAVSDALAQFKSLAQDGSTVEVYLTASSFRGEQPTRVQLDALDTNALTYSGGQNPSQLLQQFSALRGTDTYDAVFVLTDGTGYALGKSDAAAQTFTMPLWFVHLDGKFPLGYDDATLEQIQSSGGGVTGALSEALARFSTSYALAHASDNASQIANGDWVDGYFWSVLPTAEADRAYQDLTAPDESFAPFAARRLILANIQRERAALSQLNTLDELHALAKQYSVVSPYSSMLVLVNEFQHKQLDDAEKQGDRFQRETEEVGETEQQNPFDVTAVPEPHEYVLMTLGAGLLIWWLRAKRRAQAAARFKP